MKKALTLGISVYILFSNGCAQQTAVNSSSRVFVPESTLNSMQATLEKNPDDKNLRNKLIIAYITNEEYERALNILKPYLEKEPANINLLYLAGLSYLRQQEYKEAKQYFEKIQKIDPKYTPALFNLASIKQSQNDFEGARKLYACVLENNPDDADAHYNIALIYDKNLFLVQKALYHYRKAVELYQNQCEKQKLVSLINNRIAELEILEREGIK